ncbi:unnamed protein product [Penicillium pancosmium]
MPLQQPWLLSSRALRRPLPYKASLKVHLNFSTSPIRPYRPLDTLPDSRITTFQQQCFLPEKPAILPRSEFLNTPARTKWFQTNSDNGNGLPTNEPDPNQPIASLNTEYLQTHAADAFVPLELTELIDPLASEVQSFRQFHAPLHLFLEWMRVAKTSPQATRLYLAQCQLLDLPTILRDDVPTPDIVARAGKGDVYDANVWIGHPPTYTPLHRDPNPNLFVQLAGRKIVRLLAPGDGQAVFANVRRSLGKSSDRGAAAIRGEEMMHGEERALLDEMVWGVPVSAGSDGKGFEAVLDAGDGLFIPKGWWHSIKGVGEGVTASEDQDPPGSPPTPRLTSDSPTHLHLHLRLEPLFASAAPTQPPDRGSMQLSRTAYRAALLHLSVNPLFTRASIHQPSWSLTTTTPQPPTSRLYTILFPQCKTNIRQAHTMSTSTPEFNTNQETSKSDTQNPGTEQQAQEAEQLYLPETASTEEGQQKNLRLDLGADGGVSLDHLGPMVVNVDGTLSRISNWDKMTEMEQKSTLRILGKRNKQRLEALKAQGVE